MTSGKPRLSVLLIGEESAGIELLKAISPGQDRVVAVMASPSNSSRTPSFWHVARNQGFDTWPAELVTDPAFAERVRSESVDIIVNAQSLQIVHPKVLAAPRVGSFNLHPGPLPQYAGLNTPSWAIYRGESRYGVTVHEMTSRIDGGGIAYRSLFRMEDSDTPISLTLKCVQAGIPLVLRLLDTAAADPSAIPRENQDLKKRQYFGREVPNGGIISWDWPAKEVADFVRAFDYGPFPSPWGRPRAQIGKREVIVTKVFRTGQKCALPPGTVGAIRGTRVAIAACADEWILIKSTSIGERGIAQGLNVVQ